jgi:hypothetical protein
LAKRNTNLYPPAVQELIAVKSGVLAKAQTFADLGLAEVAGTLWAAAADHEARLAPLLDALGHDREAAVHRLSGAGCYRRAGDLAGAINLYRAALAGPLLEPTRKEAQQQLAECLTELSRLTTRRSPAHGATNA